MGRAPYVNQRQQGRSEGFEALTALYCPEDVWNTCEQMQFSDLMDHGNLFPHLRLILHFWQCLLFAHLPVSKTGSDIIKLLKKKVNLLLSHFLCKLSMEIHRHSLRPDSALINTMQRPAKILFQLTNRA